MSELATSSGLEAKRKFDLIGYLSLFLGVGLLLLFLDGIAHGPIVIGFDKAKENAALQATRSVNLVMFSYADDNDQQYPTGKSSTEVFQKLLDGNYATDPAIFYLPLPGKTPAVRGQKLKPENVGFDVTSGIIGSSPNQIPVVFETGFKITYKPGGVAILLPRSSFSSPRTWNQWWNDEKPLSLLSGITVAYKSNVTQFLLLPPGSGSGSAVPNFISPDFKPDGKTYRQLTPDGS